MNTHITRRIGASPAPSCWPAHWPPAAPRPALPRPRRPTRSSRPTSSWPPARRSRTPTSTSGSRRGSSPITASLPRMPSSPPVPTPSHSCSSGAWTFAMVDTATAITAAKEGVPVTAVATSTVGVSDRDGYAAIMTLPDSGIEDVTGLAGHKMQINALGGTAEALVRATMEAGRRRPGLDPVRRDPPRARSRRSRRVRSMRASSRSRC